MQGLLLQAHPQAPQGGARALCAACRPPCVFPINRAASPPPPLQALSRSQWGAGGVPRAGDQRPAAGRAAPPLVAPRPEGPTGAMAMLSTRRYFALSVLAAALVVWHAFATREQ